MKIKSEIIVSPLTGKKNAVLEKRINSSELIKAYKEKFSIDISDIFKNAPVVGIYRCMDSGYRFYFPLEIMGNDEFYNHFGKYDWYYLPWKWEHEECAKWINKGDEILEVGAAKGDFLKKVKSLKKAECTGLELSSDAVKEANEKGINLLKQSIEAHAVKFPETYDVVCSFQVLEHISNVKEVIEAMVTCLKPGGKLIISVPNNYSYIKDNPLPSKILNMPPHHMGLWDEDSLRNLSNIFPVKHLKNVIEPLQPIHADTFQYTLIYKLFKSFFVRVYWKLRIHLLIRPFLRIFSRKIKGHSVIAIFEKI